VYVSWVHWDSYPAGPIDIEVTRSTNGGVSYTRTTNPLDDGVNPRDAIATGNCARPALNGNIRYLPSPQIAVSPDGVVHVVYSYDPDGYNNGDVVNVYYRRSLDHGATWQPEIQLNDDSTLTDQWFPSLSVSGNAISAAWYDRRLDAGGNYLFTYFARVSYDNGVTWQPSEQISDVPSPVYIDPMLNICYHGDYDTQTQYEGAIYIQWSDDRLVQSGHNDPDVWFDKKFVKSDFKMAVTPATQSICVPDSAGYNLDLESIATFNQEVNLAAASQPIGLLPSFSVNPVTPPGSSTLTLDTTGGAAGSYTLVITGAALTLTHSITAGLDLFTAQPGTPGLLSPAGEARNLPLRPTFTWQAEQGQTYEIEIATDAGFTDVVATASGLASASYTPEADLPSNTVLYWRVKATNTCGESAWSEVRRFLTEAGLGECALGTTPAVLLSEGFESASQPTGWATGGTGSTWAANSTRKHSGQRSYKGEDVNTVSDQWLITPEVVLPVGQAPLTLSFWGYHKFQPGGAYDGGLLEISTDGGTTWIQLEAQLRIGGYDGTILSTSNPLYGLRAWSTSGTAWVNTIAALDEFAGQSVQLRYRLGTDDSIGYEGWYVDDVSVQACQASTTLGPDSSLSGQPGASVEHTFVLANQSTVTDSFSLAVSGNTWPATLESGSPVTLTAGATATVRVRVELPAAIGTSDSFTVTATSQGIPGLRVAAQGETQVEAQASVALSAGQTKQGAPGQEVGYTFVLTNTGSVTDTFTLAASGAWTATLAGGSSSGELGAGESVTVTLLVSIPGDAAGGAHNVTVLTATSTLNGEVSASAQAVTTAYYRSYLPVMRK
jgi:Immune inhibitor A-like, MAM domain/NPCBM-associated, NEW3 domain of alpha-galactosidase